MIKQVEEIDGLTWSTEKIEKWFENIDIGIKTKGNPLYDNNVCYRKGNLMYEYTDIEMLELYKCATDIIYFAEKYCHIKTKEGIKKVVLRDYQKDILTCYDEYQKNIFLAARQAGKCLSVNTLVKTKKKYVTLGELLNEKKSFLKFVKKIMYKFIQILDL